MEHQSRRAGHRSRALGSSFLSLPPRSLSITPPLSLSLTPILPQQKWTESYTQWSPQGTLFATIHGPGVALWGGSSFERLNRFAHPEVKLIDFSPFERYLVTWSPTPIRVAGVDARGPSPFTEEDEGNQVAVWDVMTGALLRTFPMVVPVGADGKPKEEVNQRIVWPMFKWSPDEKYLARVTPGVQISVYEVPGMGLLGKKSLKVDGVVDFEWAPMSDREREVVEDEKAGRVRSGSEGKKNEVVRENMIAFWTPEVQNQPARVTLMHLPSRTTIRSKNLFNVHDVSSLLSFLPPSFAFLSPFPLSRFSFGVALLSRRSPSLPSRAPSSLFPFLFLAALSSSSSLRCCPLDHRSPLSLLARSLTPPLASLAVQDPLAIARRLPLREGRSSHQDEKDAVLQLGAVPREGEGLSRAGCRDQGWVFCFLLLIRALFSPSESGSLTLARTDAVTAFAWEPKGMRFVLITTADPNHGQVAPGILLKTSVSFYGYDARKGDFLSMSELRRASDEEERKLTASGRAETFDNKNSNSVYWSPKGRHVLIATLGSNSKFDIDFWDLDLDREDKGVDEKDPGAGIRLITTVEHYGLTDIEWDPSGRYVATSASTWMSSVSSRSPLFPFLIPRIVDSHSELIADPPLARTDGVRLRHLGLQGPRATEAQPRQVQAVPLAPSSPHPPLARRAEEDQEEPARVRSSVRGDRPARGVQRLE